MALLLDDDEEDQPAAEQPAPELADAPEAPGADADVEAVLDAHASGNAPRATTATDEQINDAIATGTGPGPVQSSLPDLTPTVAPERPPLEPPPGARQKVTRAVESPDERAALADQAKLDDAAVGVAQSDAKARQDALRKEEEFHAKQAAEALEHKKRVEDTLKEHDRRLQVALAKQQQYFDEAKATPFHDLWAERSTGDRIFGALAAFLGGLGGGQNQAMELLNKQMDHAYQKQAADIDGKWKVYEQQTKNVGAARQGREQALADLNVLQAARYDAAAEELAQMKAAAGMPIEQARADAAVVAIRQKGIDKRLEAAKQTQERVEWDTYGKIRGAGGGAASPGVTELVRMAENGAKRSEIVAKAAELKLPEKAWKNQVDLAFVEREKGDANAEKRKAAAEAENAETEILDFHGNPMGNTSAGRSGHALAAEARKRNGNAQALVAQLDEAIKSVERDGYVVGAGGFGTEAYKERQRLLAGVQAKARVFSELPASEGGLQLEHAQIGSANSASAEQLKALRDEVVKQTNLKNRSLLTSSSRAAHEAGSAPGPPGAPSPAQAPAAAPGRRKYTAEQVSLAAEAVLPGSGATPRQRAVAKKILEEAGAR